MAASLGLDASHLCACILPGSETSQWSHTIWHETVLSIDSRTTPLTVREDNIDLGEGIIPIHILNLTCAVHLRQEHGFKRWQIGKFLETYPWLIREDGTFAFAALHRLVYVMVHTEEAAIPLDESGTVAFVRLIKPPGVTDHLNP